MGYESFWGTFTTRMKDAVLTESSSGCRSHTHTNFFRRSGIVSWQKMMKPSETPPKIKKWTCSQIYWHFSRTDDTLKVQQLYVNNEYRRYSKLDRFIIGDILKTGTLQCGIQSGSRPDIVLQSLPISLDSILLSKCQKDISMPGLQGIIALLPIDSIVPYQDLQVCALWNFSVVIVSGALLMSKSFFSYRMMIQRTYCLYHWCEYDL